MDVDELDEELAARADFHPLLFLYQTHPAHATSARTRPCLLNVSYEDFLPAAHETAIGSLRQLVAAALARLFTAQEQDEATVRDYLHCTRVLYGLALPSDSAQPVASSGKASLQSVQAVRQRVIKERVLVHPFLVQDFCSRLVKLFIQRSRRIAAPKTEVAPAPELRLTTPLAGRDVLSALFHLNFVDDKRSARQLRLDLEALGRGPWTELLERLKTRVFDRRRAPLVQAAMTGTCTNGAGVQWYVEFLLPAKEVDDLSYFLPGVLQHTYLPSFGARVEYLFVCVRTNWFELPHGDGAK